MVSLLTTGPPQSARAWSPWISKGFFSLRIIWNKGLHCFDCHNSGLYSSLSAVFSHYSDLGKTVSNCFQLLSLLFWTCPEPSLYNSQSSEGSLLSSSPFYPHNQTKSPGATPLKTQKIVPVLGLRSCSVCLERNKDLFSDHKGNLSC